jgi:hypothetical protein
MELNKIKIIIPTCDKYVHLLEGLMYTINKFWDVENEFIILGYKEPNFKLNKNWSFISLGLDSGPSNWSNDLLRYFKNFQDEYGNLIPVDMEHLQQQEQYDAQLAKLNQKRVDLKENSDGVISQMKKLHIIAHIKQKFHQTGQSIHGF